MTLENQIDSFRSLRKGWDSYKADPPNEVAIANAKRFVVLCDDFRPIQAVATAMGGVALRWDDDDDVFIEFYNNGSTWYLMCRPEDEDSMIVREAKNYETALADIKAYLENVMKDKASGLNDDPAEYPENDTEAAAVAYARKEIRLDSGHYAADNVRNYVELAFIAGAEHAKRRST